MGCAASKSHKAPTNKRPTPQRQVQDDSSTVIVASPEQEDERRIASLERDLKNNLETFMVNHMLMSVMFYENYDREMHKVANAVSKKEESLRLMTEHKKQCIMPDVVFEGVNHMVRFRRRHGPKKYMEESLVPQRMFIVHESVEILQDAEDLGHYAGIDKPAHRAYIENSNNPGYVKLNHVEYLNTKLQNGMPSNSSTNSGESSDTFRKSGDNDCPSPVSDSKPSTSYSTDVEDSEIEYGRINEARLQRPLSLQNVGRNYSGGLPPNCIQEMRMKNLTSENNMDMDLYVNRQYLVSTEFMAHFRDVFSGMLGEALGFSIEEIENSTFNTSGIFCETMDEYGRLVKCEVIPAVLNPWSDLVEWADRERTTVFDRLTTMRYVWPSPKMIEEIRILPSLTIPRGFLPKRNVNKESDLEWEVAFPKAEKYLHTRMSHAQMRCFLFIVTLYKTFIEPVTDKKGLLVDHIRTLIFWECEKNYWQWLDDKLGAKVLKVLETLYNHLAKKNLPDYFVPGKNLFENIPSKYLVTAQQYIHAIRERPVVHFLCALRNLSYPSERFYPNLDYDELYSTLFAKNAMEIFNPELYKQIETDMEQASKQHKKKLTPGQIWEKRKLDETRKRQQEEKNRKIQMEKSNLNNKPRESKDSIDLMQKLGKDDELKPVVVIPFFIEHYIKIAEVSTRYTNKNQALFYLKNAYYLSEVLKSLPSGEIVVKKLQKEIKRTEDMCKRYSFMEVNALNVPLRSSSMLGNSMQLKTKVVDMNNLSHVKNMPVNDTKQSQKKTWTEVNMTTGTDSTNTTKKGIKSARFSTVVDINHISAD